ncbi:DUF6191 domain-containing protein [Embleya hyalina]|uniref:Uncharacterized protein n=1 Tax=Embleya hyalina TaxID=516124 RepID=A0A401YIT9_9ACTN|nr:DUF6191 domain-containing protein [Embleya hyalina]GCD94511.1 hypothetical protein EHYA_02180 [Embleya hyalina]
MTRLLTGPALALLIVVPLFVLAALRMVGRRIRGQRTGVGERGLGATGVEELHALLYPGKRLQLEQRRVEPLLRDDERDGAPGRPGIDFATGTARIRIVGSKP